MKLSKFKWNLRGLVTVHNKPGDFLYAITFLLLLLGQASKAPEERAPPCEWQSRSFQAWVLAAEAIQKVGNNPGHLV